MSGHRLVDAIRALGAGEPDALASAGFGDLTPSEVADAVRVVADIAPPTQASALQRVADAIDAGEAVALAGGWDLPAVEPPLDAPLVAGELDGPLDHFGAGADLDHLHDLGGAPVADPLDPWTVTAPVGGDDGSDAAADTALDGAGRDLDDYGGGAGRLADQDAPDHADPDDPALDGADAPLGLTDDVVAEVPPALDEHPAASEPPADLDDDDPPDLDGF